MMMLSKIGATALKEVRAFRVSMTAFLLGLMIYAPTHAQTSADLKHEIDRLKQDINDMQRYVYQDKKPENMPKFSAGDASSGNVSAKLQVYSQRNEQYMRKINGRFEEVIHQIATLEGRLDSLITDVDYRLRIIEGHLSGQLPGMFVTNESPSNLQSGLVSPTPSNASATAGSANANVNATEIVNSQAGQQSLGQLTKQQMTAFANGEAPTQPKTLSPSIVRLSAPPPTLEAVPAPGNVSSTSSAAPGSIAPAGAGAQEQYDNAIGLLSKRDFDSAEVALKQFLNVNADNPLAGNAMYWLGESYYARANFRQSAAVFADAYTKYPDGGKVTDSLLKLAMSLEAIDQVEVACTSYRTLLDEHSDARQRVLSIAEKAVSKLSCP